MTRSARDQHRIVITGIGMIASVGDDREAVWRAVSSGASGVRQLEGIKGIPDGLLLGAPVDLPPTCGGRLKTIPLCLQAAGEAIVDSGLNPARIDRDRFGSAISGHMGDTDYVVERSGRPDLIEPDKTAWWEQWMPNSACSIVANRYGLHGPRLCHSTACSSGLIDVLAAVRAIQDSQCDIALAGSAEAIHPLFAAGFYRMGVLAHDEEPTRASRPFNVDRGGFVMGEGAAMFVVERLRHAQDRGARIYAEIVGGKVLADAHHVTGLNEESEALAHLISESLRRAHVSPNQIGYINAHGTGTRQNDVMEARGIRLALGSAANSVCLSASKSMLGHLVTASGSVELAITALAMRDRFAPPTINLTHPDPQCDLDCIPLVGRRHSFDYAIKLSIAFGGHLAAVVLKRWDDVHFGRQSDEVRRAA